MTMRVQEKPLRDRKQWALWGGAAQIPQIFAHFIIFLEKFNHFYPLHTLSWKISWATMHFMRQNNTDSLDHPGCFPLSLFSSWNVQNCHRINSTKAMWYLFPFSPAAVTGDSKGGQTAVLCTGQICDGGQDWPGKAAGGLEKWIVCLWL